MSEEDGRPGRLSGSSESGLSRTGGAFNVMRLVREKHQKRDAP